MDRSRYDVRIDCECTNILGYLRWEPPGQWVNVDPRAQPTRPRLALDEGGTWRGHCRKCGLTGAVRAPRLTKAAHAVVAAGLDHMPLRGL